METPVPVVLLATPDELVRQSLAVTLEQAGYPVRAVGDGAAAWAALSGDDPPQVAVLDRELGDVTGPELCRRLRMRTDGPYTWCLLLEGPVPGWRAVGSAADGVLPRPYDPIELLFRLDAARKTLEGARDEGAPPADIDHETGVWTARTTARALERALEDVRRHGPRPGILHVRLDGFESLRARYQGEALEALLRTCARRIRSTIRSSEGVGRIGPAEFLVVLRVYDADAAQRVAERVRAVVDGEPVQLPDTRVSLSVSIGVAVASPFGDDAARLIEVAAQALADADAGGGARIATGSLPVVIATG